MATATTAPESAQRPGPELRGTVRDWHVLQRPLPPVAASVRLACVTTRVACRAWRIPEVEAPAALLVSELVGTALRHAAPGPLTLRVRMTPRRLRLEVHVLAGVRPPEPADDPRDALSVTVVETTAVRWGVAPGRAGDELWAELPLPDGRPARR